MGRIVVRHVDEQRAQRRVAGLRDGRRPIEPDHQRLEAGAGVGVLARQCLDQHQSERVDVAGRRHDLAADLLGAEVVGGADRRVVHGEARVVGGDRDAEVSQLRRAEIVHGICRNEDVRGLDVAMHDPLLVHVGERSAQDGAEPARLCLGQSRLFDPLRQGESVNQFGYQVRHGVERRGLAQVGIEHRDQSRSVERR